MRKTSVALVLLNYKNWLDTLECLDSVLRLNSVDFQIIVVDNASPDDSMVHIREWAEGQRESTVTNPVLASLSQPNMPKPLPYSYYLDTDLERDNANFEKDEKLVLIQSQNNGGFAAGNNIAIRYALAKGDAEYFWFLNNDTVVESEALSQLVACAEAYKVQQQKIGIIGAKLMYYHQPQLIQAVGGLYNKWTASAKHFGGFETDIGQYDHELSESLAYPVGASMFVSVEFIRDVGVMCEDYFLYFEELDWVHRGKANGWQIGYCWQTRVFHKEGGSIGSSSNVALKSPLADFYSLRSKILFTYKFYPLKLITLYITGPLIIFNRIRRRQFDRVLSIIRLLTTSPWNLKKKFIGR